MQYSTCLASFQARTLLHRWQIWLHFFYLLVTVYILFFSSLAFYDNKKTGDAEDEVDVRRTFTPGHNKSTVCVKSLGSEAGLTLQVISSFARSMSDSSTESSMRRGQGPNLVPVQYLKVWDQLLGMWYPQEDK